MPDFGDIANAFGGEMLTQEQLTQALENIGLHLPGKSYAETAAEIITMYPEAEVVDDG